MDQDKSLQTKAQHTPPALWKDTNSITVSLLTAGKFDEVSRNVPSRINAVLECEPITSLIGHAGAQRVEQYLAAEIVKLAGNLNINPALNIKIHQVPVIAQGLMDTYKWESIEDFTLCFRRAASGMYGEIFRLDGAVIGSWMAKYLEEKYDALEQEKAKLKHKESEKRVSYTPEHADKCIKTILENLGGGKLEDPNSNAKENEYQRTKMAWQPPPKEYVDERILHLRYIQENYNAVTGKPKDTWIKEEDWRNNLKL